MSTASTKMAASPQHILIFSDDFHIESGWDKAFVMDPEEPRIRALVTDITEMLEDWTSDDGYSDLSMNDDEGHFESNFFDENIFDNEPLQEQLDYMDFDDLENDDIFTCRVSTLSSQDSPFTDNEYSEAFKGLAESMKRSQETRVSLKLKSPVKEATKHWEERRKSISTVLCSIELSSMQIQQTYFHTTHASLMHSR